MLTWPNSVPCAVSALHIQWCGVCTVHHHKVWTTQPNPQICGIENAGLEIDRKSSKGGKHRTGKWRTWTKDDFTATILFSTHRSPFCPPFSGSAYSVNTTNPHCPHTVTVITRNKKYYRWVYFCLIAWIIIKKIKHLITNSPLTSVTKTLQSTEETVLWTSTTSF